MGSRRLTLAPRRRSSSPCSRRLFPEIRKVFQFHVSRAETLRLGCYDADEGGCFEAHRDDSSVHVAHRRFDTSLFLNTGEREGGTLGFPEHGL
jgi:hypothetical protein